VPPPLEGADRENETVNQTNNSFNKEQLEMFEKLLQAQRRALIEEAGKTVHELTGKENTYADPGDRASWESESTRDLRIRDRERKLVEKIDEALKRIADGSFGECEECGELIGVGRLRARPVTTLCIGCKEEQEANEHKPNYTS
jgi:DnaK suppressor protein